jgi:hypothetical protein
LVVHAWATGLQAWQRADHAAHRPCTAEPPTAAPPPERRLALLVAGLGSDSEQASVDQLDTDGLGYDVGDVLRFSYRGGRVPDASDALAGVPATAYASADTQGDLRAAAARLAALIEAMVAAAPGVPLDLYAHSQGGVVARLAIIELQSRHGEVWLSRIGLLATMASPHGGADVATALHVLTSTDTGDTALDATVAIAGVGIDPTSTSVRQLSERSDVVAELRNHPVSDVIDAVSIAARGDLAVPVPRSAAPGMEEVVVPLHGLTAHSALPGEDAVTEELRLALAGLPPRCEGFGEALVDQAVGEGISLAEDAVGALGFALASRADVRQVRARR